MSPPQIWNDQAPASKAKAGTGQTSSKAKAGTGRKSAIELPFATGGADHARPNPRLTKRRYQLVDAVASLVRLLH